MKKRRSRGRIAIVAVFLLGLLIFGGVYFAWTTVTDIFQPVTTGQGKTIALVIQSGESTLQIADDLQAKGLIRNALAFRVWARIKGLDTHLQAGAYNLDTSMTIDAIIGQLLNAQPDYLVVAIPEGWRIEQMAQQLRAAGAGLPKFNVQDFLKYTKNPAQFPDATKYPVLKSIPQGASMEGLLFPDTYLIPVNATARDVVNMMLTEFTGKVQQNQLEAKAKQNKLSLYQMVILASIVEREVIFENDRPLVASVYWNRIYRQNNETSGISMMLTRRFSMHATHNPAQRSIGSHCRMQGAILFRLVCGIPIHIKGYLQRRFVALVLRAWKRRLPRPARIITFSCSPRRMGITCMQRRKRSSMRTYRKSPTIIIREYLSDELNYMASTVFRAAPGSNRTISRQQPGSYRNPARATRLGLSAGRYILCRAELFSAFQHSLAPRHKCRSRHLLLARLAAGHSHFI